MKFTKYEILRQLDTYTYGGKRIENRFAGLFRRAVVFLCVLATVCCAAAGIGMFVGILDNAPEVTSLSFSPVGYASRTYNAAGEPVAVLVQAGSNREEASYDEFPEDLINAFVAIEDQRFWKHDGIDLRSITRAIRGILTDDDSGGGSTITQQLVKNSVFAGGNEKGFDLYERKFQEWYIALRLENKPGKSKEEIKKQILTDYLNTINLGANTLGVKVAARRYFGKTLGELDLSECTVLASITKNPTRLNPITHPKDNQKRRLQVLKNMYEQGYITKEQHESAKSTAVYDTIELHNINTAAADQAPWSYYTDVVVEECLRLFKSRLGMTDSEARNLLYSGGLSIYTAEDPKLQKIVDEEVNNSENYDTKKYSFKWRMTLVKKNGSKKNYGEHNILGSLSESDESFNGLFSSEDAVKSAVEAFKKGVMEEGDEIEGERLDITLEPQVSFVLMDQRTREVKAISGGRGEKKYSLTLNRATGSKRQPGSTFKVLTAFAPAIEENGATLATVYYDRPYTVGEKEFRNWWNRSEFFGFSNIREGIEFSMNIVAVRCLVETVGPEEGVEFARRMGISTLTDSDENAAVALGGLTEGVTNLELTNAFACIADGGIYKDAHFVTKILDHDGNLLIDLTNEDGRRVMKESTAFLLTDARRRSLEPHHKWAEGYTVNNTSSRSHLDNMTAAGKSGTTTNNNDVWFVGFTPYYTAGVWGGCDENQSLYNSSTGEYNGGTSYHKDIWKKIMDRVHEGLSERAFEQPDDIVRVRVCRKSGLLAGEGCEHDIRDGSSAVYTEYFTVGSAPVRTCNVHTPWGKVMIPLADQQCYTDDGGWGEGMEDPALLEPETEPVIADEPAPGEYDSPGHTDTGTAIYDNRFLEPTRGPGSN